MGKYIKNRSYFLSTKLEDAIKDEKAGIYFYQRLLDMSDDKAMNVRVRAIMKDEKTHLKRLSAERQRLLKKGR